MVIGVDGNCAGLMMLDRRDCGIRDRPLRHQRLKGQVLGRRTTLNLRVNQRLGAVLTEANIRTTFLTGIQPTATRIAIPISSNGWSWIWVPLNLLRRMKSLLHRHRHRRLTNDRPLNLTIRRPAKNDDITRPPPR